MTFEISFLPPATGNAVPEAIYCRLSAPTMRKLRRVCRKKGQSISEAIADIVLPLFDSHPYVLTKNELIVNVLDRREEQRLWSDHPLEVDNDYTD